MFDYIQLCFKKKSIIFLTFYWFYYNHSAIFLARPLNARYSNKNWKQTACAKDREPLCEFVMKTVKKYIT